MSKFSLDQHGVPRLSANQIEMKAEEVIEFFEPSTLGQPCHTRIVQFLQETNRRFQLAIDFEQDLGQSKHGHKILGTFCFQPRAIFVDKSLKNDCIRTDLVVAHEFGHFVLHRDLIIKKKGYSDVDIFDTTRDVATGRKILTTPRDWLEWQANRFARAILMPRATTLDALLSVQKSLGITHNQGRIFLDHNRYSKHDFNSTLVQLQLIFEVGRRNLEYRLTELGYLIDRRNKDVKHISQLLAEG